MAAYRKAVPYRKARTYRGLEESPGVALTGIAQALAAPWNASSPAAATWQAPMRQSVPRADAVRAAFDAITAQECGAAIPLMGLSSQAGGAAAAWMDYQTHGQRTVTARQVGLDLHGRSSALPWGDFDGQHGLTSALAHHSSQAGSVHAAIPWRQLASHALSCSAFWQSVIARGGVVSLPWGPIAARQAGTRVEWPVEPDPQPGVITVPNLPVYVMLPTLSAVRLPDRTPIPLLGISLQCDFIGSWAWSFSAPMAVSAGALIEAGGGEPTEIEVTVNGYVWTFKVDAVDDNRRFGSKTVTLRGRSRSSELAQPYAPGRTFTQTADTLAAQLADNELVNTGWTLVWDAVDWLVPGGTFSYSDLAPIDAIAQVAGSIGATVQSDPETKQIRVAPAYATSPWAWGDAVPYAILPASILTAGDSSWEGGTNADGVYVYAENAASGALVKITGTAGARQLPMIVDRLAVHADAQRERGRNELAGAGKKRRVNRTYPLFPTPAPAGQPDLGVIPLGALLEIADTDETWRGQVMAVRIDAQRSGTALSVRQHLTLERQYR